MTIIEIENNIILLQRHIIHDKTFVMRFFKNILLSTTLIINSLTVISLTKKKKKGDKFSLQCNGILSFFIFLIIIIILIFK